MSSSRSLTPLDASQYDAIEDAVRETERGRWFLTEYARRNRNADTEVLLDAIRRIENVVTTDRPDDVGRFRGDLMEMADAIARTRAEVAALSTAEQGESRLTVASEALDAIVRATERATSDILSAAEEVQEAAWTLRETGIDSELCDALDRHATQIYTACSFQDLTAQRTSRVVHTLRYLENRIASMIGIWGSPEDAVPPLGEDAPVPATALDQSDVDRFLDMEGPAPAPAVSTLRPLPTMVLDDDLAFLPASPETSEPTHEEEPAEPITTEMAAPVAVLADEIPADLFAMEMPEIEAAAEAETVSAVLVPAPAELELAEAFGAEDESAFEVVADIEAVEGVDVVEEAEPAAELTIPATPEAVMPLAEPLIVAAVEPMAADDLAAAFLDLDTLSIEEKIALFA
ncbi:hypothetical protein [Methylorubrum extorquens]|uniref:Chemotaxis protein CheZ n=1 Tax=Methylorubrum extorquens (strain ATCC 14718 / DSM 1338 / JCM 2805 / NCIMB 9133 / AM1) TaxID=272630 RepID=C5AVB9_METEA|nr:hypothetical protein [Methylorubrum extorquens]ACS38587.1 conserved hypothetical protein [Methylorubrum extorquens AM1]MCP1543347.1 hypothetical protein [Methylorubrum extorquens]MCP1589308.1 hypothetical protein [Methylorubrum extorquens]